MPIGHEKNWIICPPNEKQNLKIIIKYMYQIITLYSLNLYHVVCQLYLIKARWKIEIKFKNQDYAATNNKGKTIIEV